MHVGTSSDALTVLLHGSPGESPKSGRLEHECVEAPQVQLHVHQALQGQSWVTRVPPPRDWLSLAVPAPLDKTRGLSFLSLKSTGNFP